VIPETLVPVTEFPATEFPAPAACAPVDAGERLRATSFRPFPQPGHFTTWPSALAGTSMGAPQVGHLIIFAIGPPIVVIRDSFAPKSYQMDGLK
jgi:hypothetical protein